MRTYRVVDASELADAYAAADYRVSLDGDALRLRVGGPAGDLEAYWPADRYVFLTAWNPASEPHSEAANTSADALLVAQLDADGIARQPAWAAAPDGGWREPGWLLADVDDHQADRLAREFGQAAVLCWARGEPVRLRMLVERPDPFHPGGPLARYTDWPGDVTREAACPA
ncbi:DUF3293 domain-containing protein [Novilysobacter arseniciresistens]|uniref:DUF3293 domain-containing protein n=1 Tax=Novilysobacter arseniciresistens TaxID=1385522 RepID=UPI00068D2BC1|nr:DUF3293 domain-containing protein [Lysobacter arseniciresistens]